MITLFRRIRERLIAQGSITKYLLYAIGEILLVVIGILIALQVNNWNEERKVNQERISLINALKTDHESTLTIIERQFVQTENRGTILRKLLSYSAGEAINISDDSLKVMLQESIRFEFTNNFSTTYEQAKSSGKLSLIRNEDLLKALSKNEENIEGLFSVDLPVFDQSYSTFNANIEIISMFDRLGNLDLSPAKHPDLSLSGPELYRFIKSPETYKKLYHIYFLNNLMYLWWGSTKQSTEVVLNEINVSLTQY